MSDKQMIFGLGVITGAIAALLFAKYKKDRRNLPLEGKIK